MSHPLTTFLRSASTQSRRLLVLVLCTIIAIALAPAQVTHAGTTIIVNDSADGITANCTLRAAIQSINTGVSAGSCGADASTITIQFQPSVTSIVLSSGELLITKSMTIQGNGANPLTINGNNNSRIFDVNSGISVTISNLTTTNGRSQGQPGGAIINHGTLTLLKVTVSNSSTDQEGGGIENDGTLTISKSTISGNSTFGGNDSDGGGVRNTGANAQVFIINSTISGNTANSGNRSADGGGLRNSFGTMTIVSSTIYQNTAGGNGGNIHRGSGTVSLKSTIVAGGTVGAGEFGPDIWGTVSSLGYNLIQSVSGATIGGDTTGNLTGTAPNLGSLQNNGGPTSTHAELVGSISIDAGNPAGCTDQNGVALTSDQRGIARKVGVRCDIGAYEMTRPDTIGVYNGGNFVLSSNNSAVLANFWFGPGGSWAALTGDFDGNNADSAGVVNNNEVYFSNNNSTVAIHQLFGQGSPRVLIVGDWDGNGTDTLGNYNNADFKLSNDNSTVAQHFFFGPGGSWQPIVGDWDGNGTDTIGIYNNGEFYLSNDNSTTAQHFFFGPGGSWQPIVGDWDGNGTDTIGIYNNGEFILSNDNSTTAQHFWFGPGGTAQPLAGHWGNGAGSLPNQRPTSAPVAPAATPAPAPTFVPKK